MSKSVRDVNRELCKLNADLLVCILPSSPIVLFFFVFQEIFNFLDAFIQIQISFEEQNNSIYMFLLNLSLEDLYLCLKIQIYLIKMLKIFA